MNAISVKTKVAGIADKVTNSNLYKAVEKGAVTASAFLATAGISAVNAFAEAGGAGSDITVDTAQILNTANPYIKAAVSVLCVVGGFKLGMRILRGSFH